MFWLQSQNTCFDQCLDFVLKNIAPTSRMMNHPMKKIIVGIIHSSHFVWASNLATWACCLCWASEKVSPHARLWMSIVFDTLKFCWNYPSLIEFLQVLSMLMYQKIQLCHSFYCLFPTCFWGSQTFSWYFSYLGLFNKLLPSVGFDSSYVNFYFVEKVIPTCLKPHRQRHACRL